MIVAQLIEERQPKEAVGTADEEPAPALLLR